MGMLAVLLVTLTGCERSVLDPAGPVSRAEVVIMFDALAIMLAIVVPVILCTLAFAWWYRATNRQATFSTVGLLRPPRDSDLVDPRPRHFVSRRHRLDRIS